MPILVPGPVRLQPTRTIRAVRQLKPLMAWTLRPSLYGTPSKICLPGQAPAIWKRRPYLTGVAKHRESGLVVVDKTEAANCLRKAGQGSKKTGTTGTSHELAVWVSFTRVQEPRLASPPRAPLQSGVPTQAASAPSALVPFLCVTNAA